MTGPHLPSYIRVLSPSGEGRDLIIRVEPHAYDGFSLKAEDVRDIARAAGAEDWRVDQSQIEALLKEQNTLTKTKDYSLASQIDCSVDVKISNDHLRAWVTVKPPCGGKPLTRELLQAELQKANVVFGVKEELIAELVKAASAQDFLIAEGKKPEPGDDASLEQLVREDSMKGKPDRKSVV